VGPLRSYYREVWAVDFEFTALTGDRPRPLCLVGRELLTGRLVRFWIEETGPMAPPFAIGPDALFVAYYASAELGCFLALNWPFPARILDLYVEFRNLTSGLSVPCGHSLLGVLACYGLDGIGTVEKAAMRSLAMRGGPYSGSERQALLDYCQTDVDALARLLPAMLPMIDLPRALLRGRYMAAVARIEWNGIPIDADALGQLRENWDPIKTRLIETLDQDYGVYVPTDQRPINPDSVFGSAILETAREWDLNPDQLARAAEMVWREERDSTAAIVKARKKARQMTGLTTQRIHQWEDAGKDYSTWPRLDDQARELAGLFPDLAIGPGYVQEDGYQTIDHAGLLWDKLREPDESPRPRHDPGNLRQAAELVASRPETDWSYSGPMTFSSVRFGQYLARKGIPWPRLDSGGLVLDDDTFREMARAYPAEIGPLRELRHSLSQMKLNELAVGTDGRNRCLLSPFQSKTGRNQPSNSKYIFGPSVWLRSLIRPEPGRAVAYVDWSQQELAIAAALSGDRKMMDAYQSGDFYLTFAKMAGAAPPDATKRTHGNVRDQFKTVALGVLYGLAGDGLARKLNVPPCHGRGLLGMHKEVFRTFWQWSDRVEMQAILSGRLRTVFGWTVHVGPDANPRSLRNFPMQAHGADMMRLACCLATESGIPVCAVVHDALLVEGAIDDIEDTVARTQAAMRQASELVLPGFPLRTEAKIVRYPDRYSDPRGESMWETVMGIFSETSGENLAGNAYPCQR
jgi:hypothetical protein